MNNEAVTRIVLADDHALVLEGLRSLLNAEPDLRVVATATDGERLLEAIHRFNTLGLSFEMRLTSSRMWWRWTSKCPTWMD